MILMIVGQNQTVDFAYAIVAQIGNDHTFADIKIRLRSGHPAGVDQNRPTVRCDHQRRIALPDIDEMHLQGARLPPDPDNAKSRQQDRPRSFIAILVQLPPHVRRRPCADLPSAAQPSDQQIISGAAP